MIETDRLIIRVPTLDDLEKIQAAKEANWAELQQWMCWTSDDQRPIDAMRYYIETIIPADHEKGGLHLYAFHKDNGDFVMSSGLTPTDTPDVYTTGYWGNVDYLGQGYATETMRAIIDFAFATHGATMLEIAYYEGNEKSRRIIDKCGFEFVRTLTKAHKSHATGEMLDEYRYVLTRDQWRARHVP